MPAEGQNGDIDFCNIQENFTYPSPPGHSQMQLTPSASCQPPDAYSLGNPRSSDCDGGCGPGMAPLAVFLAGGRQIIGRPFGKAAFGLEIGKRLGRKGDEFDALVLNGHSGQTAG
jgi:hypothetical protein